MDESIGGGMHALNAQCFGCFKSYFYYTGVKPSSMTDLYITKPSM